MATNARLAATVANLSHGTAGAIVKRAKGWKGNPLLVAVETVAVEEGYTAFRTAHLAEIGAGNVNTLAENNTGITPTALPTLTAVASTLISIYVATAKSSESEAAQDPMRRARLTALVEALVGEAFMDYIAHNGTNGIMPLISGLTAVGTSGADATVQTDRAALESLVLAGGHEPRFMLITDIIGFNQRKNDIEQSSGGVWSSVGLSEQARSLFSEGMVPTGMGATPFQYDQFDYWVTNGTGVTNLYNDGTDTYDLLCAYPTPGDMSIDAVQSWAVLCGRRNPALAREDAQLFKTINGVIGIYKWMAPLVENSSEQVYLATFDCFTANANRARAIRRAQA